MLKNLIKVAFLFCSLFCSLFCNVYGQTNTDLELITNKVLFNKSEFSNYKIKGNSAKFIELKDSSAKVKTSLGTYFFGSLLYVYQNVLSKQLSRTCPYHTTCSNFSKKCIKQYGIIKGILLTADRLTKCNRISNSEIGILDLYEDGTIKDHLIKEDQ